MQIAENDSTVLTPAVQSSNFIVQKGLVARRIHDDLLWGEGAIVLQLAVHEDSKTSEEALLQAVLQSIEPVASDELPYSSCTDGRIPVRLMDGSLIPVREQMVGADIVSAFYVAEVLGASFYRDATAPVEQRVKMVAQFLHENDLMPSSHLACGAAGGFVTILQNLQRFTTNELFIARQRELIPQEIYDEVLYEQITVELKSRLEKELYVRLTAQTFLDAALQVSGKRAIAELKDDGRGVHGHVEECIIRLRIPGHALNEAKVAQLTGGREVFGVNDNRIERVARLFGRGNDVDYKKAYMALEDFADAGHGTLTRGLPTWIVEPATA